MQRQSAKILVVDDSPIQIGHLKKCLSKSGFEIYTTTKSEDAVELIEELLPDLVLLDIMMPKRDGYCICEALKSNAATKDIAIIFITAKNERQDKIKGFCMGAFDYITKPFYTEEVEARVKNAINLKLFQDELKNKNSILEILSIRDELTVLYNRRYVLKRLDEEIERAKRYNRTFSCIMIDIDYFKKVNDAYGHQGGDIVLRYMGDMLRKNLRTVDIASRYGGEEFLLILPETDLTGAKTVAEKLRNIVCNAEPPEGLPENFRFTISLGIAIYPNDAESRERLIAAADEALYTAKGAGRNCWMAYQNGSNR
ncbi:MAG: diguanylate cyclase [Nitrospirota bacterium]